MSVWLCVMSFTWICCLLLELCSMIPKTAWSQGWLFKYVLWQNENWEIDSFTTTVKKKRDWQKNKATVSSLLCFQCLLQASDGDFSISWWKWHFSICRCFLFDIMGRLFARGQTNPNHGFTTSRRFCLIFYSWRIVYFNVFREFVALSVQTHLLIKKTWRTFICSSPRIV